MAETLNLDVNGEAWEVARGATVADVVGVIGCGERGVAVAVNSELVRRAAWSTAELADGDQLEILHAVSGG
jgi:sulfur carrier protein